MNKHLYIKAGYKNHKTFLEKSFWKQPFKLANITENKNENLLRLMIMSSSPGVLNNDNYSIEIEVEENAFVWLTTQGYQRLFTMKDRASQCINVSLKNNAAFYFLPHPNVPHKLSDFSSFNNIYLSPSHHLIWSEIITCGRKLCGEQFEFTKFRNVTKVYLENKLVVKENVLLEPIKNNIHAIGNLEGYTHQSALLFINDSVDVKKISDACRELLSAVKEISFGISLLPVNGVIIRMLGNRGEVLFECNNKLAEYIHGIIASLNTHAKERTLISQ